MVNDKRFANYLENPIYTSGPKKGSKIQKDERFKLKSEGKLQAKTDPRGRLLYKTLTDIDIENESTTKDVLPVKDGKNSARQKGSDKRKVFSLFRGDSDGIDIDSENEVEESVPKEILEKLRDPNIDYARGQGNLISESSSDDEASESEESDDAEEVVQEWGELDAEAERTEEITHRLAVCNMDWDRIRAVDMMVVFSSFLSAGDTVKSVVIYPSDFGLQRMKEEEIKGPAELVETVPDEDETEEGSQYHMEKLRRYQLNRLKYYYAIVTFNSAASANKVYTECDGMEYESSATKVDLRFVPDDMVFDQEPKEICNELPDVKKYTPRFFTNTALQQAKVKLTWDETDQDRVDVVEKIMQKKYDEIPNEKIKRYIASGSEDESEKEADNFNESDPEGSDSIEKYRALLNDIEKEEKINEGDVEMEFTWEVGLQEKAEKVLRDKVSESKTPFQKYLDKRKQKRKEKHEARNVAQDNDSDISSDVLNKCFDEEFEEFNSKKKKYGKGRKQLNDMTQETKNNLQADAELELLLMDSNKKRKVDLEDESHSKTKSKKHKRKQRLLEKKNKQDDFDVRVDDERFTALYTSHHFNIDPTDPSFKKSKGIEKFINAKLERKHLGNTSENLNDVKESDLSVLSKVAKTRTKRAFQTKKNNEM